MSKHHGLYKFVDKESEEIIYIGKTNNDLKSRVMDHVRGKGLDAKFNTYKGKYKIYVCFLPNATETDILERALINKYKPVLNVTDNHKGISDLISVKEPKWQKYDEIFKNGLKKNKKKDRKTTKKKDIKEDIFLGNIHNFKFYISNTYEVSRGRSRETFNVFDSKDEALEYLKELLTLIKNHAESDGEEYSLQSKWSKSFNKLWQSGRGFLMIKIKGKCSKNMNLMTCVRGHRDKLDREILDQIYFNKDAVDIVALVIDDLLKNNT